MFHWKIARTVLLARVLPFKARLRCFGLRPYPQDLTAVAGISFVFEDLRCLYGWAVWKYNNMWIYSTFKYICFCAITSVARYLCRRTAALEHKVTSWCPGIWRQFRVPLKSEIFDLKFWTSPLVCMLCLHVMYSATGTRLRFLYPIIGKLSVLTASSTDCGHSQAFHSFFLPSSSPPFSPTPFFVVWFGLGVWVSFFPPLCHCQNVRLSGLFTQI